MAKYIAVQGCSLELSDGEGLIAITSAPSSVAKCEGKGIYTKEIVFSVSGYTGGDVVSGSGSGAGIIRASAQTNKSENKAVVLEGDTSDTIEIVGVNSRGRPSSAFITVKVKSAGQTFTKGE